MQQSTVSKTSSLNNCCLPYWEDLKCTWQRNFFLPQEGCAWSLCGTPHLCSPQEGQTSLQICPDPSAEAPSAVPKLAGHCSVSAGPCCVRGTDQRVQGATQARGTGAGWPQAVKHKGRKGGTGSSKCCSSSGSQKPPWDGSGFVLLWWHSAIPELWAGFGVADISPDKGA